MAILRPMASFPAMIAGSWTFLDLDGAACVVVGVLLLLFAEVAVALGGA